MSTKDNSSEEENNQVFCPFLKKHPMYELGTEFGILICRMMMSNEVEDDFRRANQEQILLLANRMGWSVTKLDDGNKKGYFRIEMHSNKEDQQDE